MSNLRSGRVCWLTMVALLLLLSNHVSAAANPAIIVNTTGAGYYDVSLDITQLDLLPGLRSWDDLAFTSLVPPVFSDHPGDLTRDEWEKLAVLDVASGTRCQHTPGCMDNISSHHQRMSESDLSKRFLYMYKWVFRPWTTRTSNPLKGGALGALATVISGVGHGIIQLSRPAICMTANGDQACISWGGAGINAIAQPVALQVVRSGQAKFGGKAISGEDYDAMLAKSSKRKRNSYNVCLSSTPTCPS